MSTKGPDVLLVNPSTNEEVYGELAASNAAREPPFLAALTAGFIRKKGYSVDLLDANVDGLSQQRTAELIQDANPGLVAIIAHGHQPSASSQLMGAVGKLCKEVKGRTNLPIFMSGIHPSSLPERTLREEACDYVAHGEMQYTLLGLLQGSDRPEKIPGLCYLDNGGVFHANQAASLIKNLTEEFSDVAWDLVPPFSKYRTHNWHAFEDIDTRSPFGALYTSLGCPFKCTFCCINAEFKASIADNQPGIANKGSSDLERLVALDQVNPAIRYWNPQWAVDQITYMAEQGVRHIKIIDEMFYLNPQQLEGIANGLIERGLGDKLNFWAYARIDTIKDNPARLDKMKKAGFNWLCVGIESANTEVRHGADKKFKNEMIFERVRQIENAGINVLGNYMVGLRTDTQESMKQTYQMAKELMTAWFNVYATMAYPGAPDYHWAKQKGVQLPGDPGVPGGWTAYSHHSWYTLPLSTERLSAAEVLDFRDTFYHAIVEDPSYHELLRRRFGESQGQKIINNLGGKKKIARRILGDPQPVNFP